MAEIDQLPIVSPPTVFYPIEDPHLHAAQILGGADRGPQGRFVNGSSFIAPPLSPISVAKRPTIKDN